MSRYPSRLHFFIRHLQQVLARPVLREIEANLDHRSVSDRNLASLIHTSHTSPWERDMDPNYNYNLGGASAFQTSRDIVRAYLSPTGVRIRPEISKRGGTL